MKEKSSTNIYTAGAQLEPWPTKYDNDYFPNKDEQYWDEKVETNKELLDQVILYKLKNQIEWAWEHSAFYKNKWSAAGVSPSTLKNLDDLAKFPVVVKQELRESQKNDPPFGDHLCVSPKDVRRIHGTSGTTGDPTIFGLTEDDKNRIANAHARIMWGAGVRPGDIMFIGSPLGLYLGSWGVLWGSERLSATVLPFGAGVAGQTKTAAHLVKRLKPSCFYGTPSYALRFAEIAEEEGIDPLKDFNFRTMLFSGEPGAGVASTKKKVEQIYGAHAIDMGSMAEMTPWMSNAECSHRTGMHLWQDIVYTEVCDPKTHAPVPFGSEGTPVYTHLERTSQPMIRLWSGDLTCWDDEPCPCGRVYPRLPRGIYGRVDDMFIIRGHNVYPSAVEDVLRSIEGVGDEFRVIISREKTMDELVLQVEYLPSHSNKEKLKQLQLVVTEKSQNVLGVRPVIHMVGNGTLERTEFKARRVIDNRDLFDEMKIS